MHASVMDFVRKAITDAHGKRVLEIGSANVNGSARHWIEQQGPEIYIGTDTLEAKYRDNNIRALGTTDKCYVDLPIPAEDLCDYFRNKTFDIVVCTEVLEHVKDWIPLVDNALYLLKVGGYLVLTTRSPGFPYHEYPGDFWRFTVENMKEMFGSYIELIENDPEHPGVFVKVRKESAYAMANIYVDVERVEKP